MGVTASGMADLSAASKIDADVLDFVCMYEFAIVGSDCVEFVNGGLNENRV